MSIYDDEQEECPGEETCENTYCEERQDYEVTWTYEITAIVSAHSEEEAGNVADDVGMQIRVQLPDDPHDLMSELTVETDGDSYIESVREKQARHYQMQKEMERLTAEEEASAE